MTRATLSPTGIAYDRSGPRGDLPLVLVHAGVGDRRMWDAVWPNLTARHDVVRLDLRGFGESTARPSRRLSPVEDVLDTLASLGIAHCHLVGASFGAAVAVEVTLTRPELAASLMLLAPGGPLITEATPDMEAFAAAEESALSGNDLDAAVEANLAWWVDGPHRDADAVDPAVRDLVGRMQRRAFELTAGWDDLEEDKARLDPPALDRLGEVRTPTLVLVGALDLDAIIDTAGRVTEGIAGARRVDWPDTAHLPSMERPDDFVALLDTWVRQAGEET